jgi:hypothetical protein
MAFLLTNGIPLGWSLLLPAGTVNGVQTLKVKDGVASMFTGSVLSRSLARFNFHGNHSLLTR